MSDVPEPVEFCPGCKSAEIVRGVKVGISNEINKVGLKCEAGLFQPGTEPILADLCDGCGLILRFYVTEKRRWVIG